MLVETLGTGQIDAAPISRKHEAFFNWLEQERRLVRCVIRTDYKFSSVDEAIRICSSFFKPEVIDRVRTLSSPVIPECTGLWFRSKALV